MSDLPLIPATVIGSWSFPGWYAHFCDDGRFDQWGDLFTDDATLRAMGVTYEGRDGAKGFITKFQPPEARGKHVCTNTVIDIDGDRARGWTDYVFVSQEMVILSAGRYHDVLVRDGDRWRFQDRRIVFMGEE